MESRNAKDTDRSKPTSLRVLDGQTELAEDELLRIGEFFSKWGREILIAVAVAGAIFMVTKFLREADVKQRKIASEKFEETRATFTQLKAAVGAQAEGTGDDAAKKSQAEQVETLKVKLTEELKVLGDAKEPYKSLAGVYQALAANLLGDTASAQQSLAALDLTASLAEESPQTMYVEFAALNAARALIDSDASYPQGRSVLKTLAEKGRYVATNAAIALTDISRTVEEKAEAKAVLDSLVARVPESQDVLKGAVQRLSNP